MVRLVQVSVFLGAFALAASAGPILYTFGADPFGAPTSLNSMDPASAASVTNVQTPVGDGSIGFNGGLVGIGNTLYGVGNDSNGIASLYSLQTDGLGLALLSAGFNTAGDGTGFVFTNGLGAIGNSFYAVGQGGGIEALFQIGNGTSTAIQALNTFGGTFAGIAYDNSLSRFFGVIAGATNTDFHGDLLVQFQIGGNVGVVANLTSKDGALVGSHLSGLADDGNGILYNIYMDPNTNTGQLEQIDLTGGFPVTTLYDTQIPLSLNAGIAIAAAPEPGTMWGIGGGLLLLAGLLKRVRK